MLTAADFAAHPFFPFIWEGRPIFGHRFRVKAGRPAQRGAAVATAAARLRASRTGRGWVGIELRAALLGELRRRRLPAAV